MILLIQIALLLIVARLGAEASRRAGLPVVVGELAAGLILGPSVFGHLAPGAFLHIFPASADQYHLLEVVGTLGMILLLLLTGLETDLRLLRGLGKSALLASFSGMIVPFALGFGLGMLMPDAYLAMPGQRLIFSLFLATAMSISAMPVIAKILMDLDLTRRNLGVVILSAGVVDDTTGWIILSLIAGMVSHGSVRLADLGKTLGLTLAFIVGCTVVLYPLLRWLVRVCAQRFRTTDSDMVLIIGVTLLCAALTEWIGIHAVFGAFAAGVVLRQVPAVRPESVHRLEAFVFSVLGPIFFGIVGLKVDLWGLQGGGMLGIVLAVACVGKLIGCLGGGLGSGMSFWEALSVAVAMNARGAMELVVAMIGLSLGVLNQQMFSIIVVVAVVTSFMAPLLLRLTMRRVAMTAAEAQRLVAAASVGVFDPDRVGMLVPTAGGPNALGAARLALGVARRSALPVRVLHISPRTTFMTRARRLFCQNLAGQGIDEHLAALRALADPTHTKPLEIQHQSGGDAAQAICAEARKGCDLIVIGASQHGPLLGGNVLEEVVAQAPCHVAIVRTARPDAAFRRLLVLVDGSAVSRVAVEFAVRYCEVTESALTLAVLGERDRLPAGDSLTGEYPAMRGGEPVDPFTEELIRISPVFRASAIVPEVLHLSPQRFFKTVLEKTQGPAAAAGHDLMVIGAENRAIRRRLFFGHDNERLIRETAASVAILIPHLGRLTIGPT